MEVHTFMKTFMQVLLLAIPGLGKFTNLHSCVQFDVCLVATLLEVNSQHPDKLKKNSFGRYGFVYRYMYFKSHKIFLSIEEVKCI